MDIRLKLNTVVLSEAQSDNVVLSEAGSDNVILPIFLQVTNKTKITYVTGCLEVCPETQRIHGHVYVQFSGKVPLEAFRTWLKQFENGTHVYSFGSGGNTFFCKGSSEDCVNYIRKPETKLDGFDIIEVGSVLHIKGTASGGRGTRTDLNDLKEALDEGKSISDLYDEHFSTLARHIKFAERYVRHKQQIQISSQLKDQYSGAILRPWQRTLLETLTQVPDTRTVHWYWDHAGNVGKTFMGAYVTHMHGALVLPVGKVHDMCYALGNNQAPIYIFDIPRTYEDKLDGVYNLIEMVKNQRVSSYKYESTIINIPIAHVVVFANFEPDLSNPAMSKDRYNIVEIFQEN